MVMMLSCLERFYASSELLVIWQSESQLSYENILTCKLKDNKLTETGPQIL